MARPAGRHGLELMAEGAITRGRAGFIGDLRARLKARPDTEHEQGILRLVIGALLMVYLLPAAPAAQQTLVLYVGTVQLAVSLLIFLRIAYTRHVSPARRVFAQFADVATISAYMAICGQWAAPLFLLFLWVTLGSGFRFGAKYLVSELAMSLAGFGVAIYVNDWWREHTALGVGLLVGMFAVAMYVLSLVRRLHEALARAEAANVAKRRFISVVSHEMRTPLNAIIGMADLLRDTALTREQADMLQTLRGSSRIMLGLVEDVLDFSKIEAGKLVLEKTDFDLHALVNSTCRIVAAQAAAKGLEFVVSIMPEVPPAVRGDAHYLRQILINLVGNALKFTEHGSITVHVSQQSETDTRVRLKFSIRDTGLGIAPEAQSRIFESFTQADQSTTRRFGGTGLGTTIAKQLAELMGGRIGLESALGLGSTFWFEVQLEKQPERPAAGVGELAAARVLLIGFPAADREAVEQALAGWGALPVAAASVEEAAARVVAEISLAKPYHSAVLYATHQDLKLAQRFRQAVPNPAPPTILAIPQEADVQRFDALTAGFAAILELPFDKRRLFNVLHSVSAGEEVRGGVVRLQDYARRTASSKKLRLLVADDNPTNREVVGKILERGGHAATLVNDGEQALDALERESYDLVLLDRNMPGIGGVEALQALRLMTRGRERLPVIMLSADVTAEAKREALEAGADAFLAKPIEALRLLEEIQKLCAAASERGRYVEPRAPVRVGASPQAVSAVNLETLQHLRQLGSSAEFIEKLVGVFVSDNSSLLARMEQVLAGRNYHEFRSLLHAMKGSSASMGTDRLTELCSSVAKLSDAEMRLQSPGLLRALTEELTTARTELERILRDRRSSVL